MAKDVRLALLWVWRFHCPALILTIANLALWIAAGLATVAAAFWSLPLGQLAAGPTPRGHPGRETFAPASR